MSTQNNINLVPEVSATQEGNVVLVDALDVGKITTLAPNHIQKTLNSNEGVKDSILQDLTSRWIILDQFKWEANMIQGTNIKEYSLPKAIFNSPYSKNNASLILFKSWLYYNTDMEVRIQINANRFQFGQLQCSYFYQYYEHIKNNQPDFFDNIYMCSQRPHGLIKAQNNNTLSLLIPYKNIRNYISGSQSELRNKSDHHIATLLINVLTPLTCPQAGPLFCNVTVFFKFSNTTFNGMIAPSLISHQGLNFGTILKGAESFLHQVNVDYNRDYPRNVLPNQRVVLTNSNSWSVGTNAISSAAILRLDNVSTTPSNESIDEMSCSYLTKIFGLLQANLEWHTNMVSGTRLITRPVTPLMNFKHYPQYHALDPINHSLASYQVPPVGVISSLFSFWRGSLEYRFDIVGSIFHTGRIMVAFVPGLKGKVATYEQCLSSYALFFDLDGEQTFTFKVPFISDKPFLPINCCIYDDSHNAHYISGYIHIYVINQLIPMESIANSVFINIYQRAGEDFELAVPQSPLLGLFYDKDYLFKGTRGHVKPDYNPVYCGNWRFWGNGDRYILRYGEVTDHIAQFTNMLKDKIYKIPDNKALKIKVGNTYFRAAYFCVIFLDYPQYIYLTPFVTLEQAKNFLKSPWPEQSLLWKENGDYSDLLGINFEEVPSYMIQENRSNQTTPEIITISEIIHQGDEKDPGIDVAPLESIKNLSLSNFGESFDDLKNLCRRFQLYSEVSFTIKANTPLGAILVKFPITPLGCKLNLTSGEAIADAMNFTRNGVIPLIASGFRYFRGGLRFKAIISCPSSNLFVSICHQPNIFMDSDVPALISKWKSRQDFISHGYAMLAQSTNMNEVLEFEVPYYLNSNYGLLSKNRGSIDPGITEFSKTLGTLAIANLSRLDKDTDVAIQIYYSLADDTRFSAFMGFPGLVFANKIPSFKIEHQGIFTLPQDIKRTVESSALVIENTFKCISESLSEKIFEVLNSAVLKSEEFLNLEKSKLSLKVGRITSQLAHIYLGNLKNFWVSLVSIICEIGLVKWDQLYNLVELYIKHLGSLFCEDERRKVEHQSFKIKDPILSREFGVAITAIVLAGLGLTAKNSFKISSGILPFLDNTFKVLFKDIGTFCLNANYITTFLRNNIFFLKHCMQRF